MTIFREKWREVFCYLFQMDTFLIVVSCQLVLAMLTPSRDEQVNAMTPKQIKDGWNSHARKILFTQVPPVTLDSDMFTAPIPIIHCRANFKHSHQFQAFTPISHLARWLKAFKQSPFKRLNQTLPLSSSTGSLYL